MGHQAQHLEAVILAAELAGLVEFPQRPAAGTRLLHHERQFDHRGVREAPARNAREAEGDVGDAGAHLVGLAVGAAERAGDVVDLEIHLAVGLLAQLLRPRAQHVHLDPVGRRQVMGDVELDGLGAQDRRHRQRPDGGDRSGQKRSAIGPESHEAVPPELGFHDRRPGGGPTRAFTVFLAVSSWQSSGRSRAGPPHHVISCAGSLAVRRAQATLAQWHRFGKPRNGRRGRRHRRTAGAGSHRPACRIVARREFT